LSRCTALAANLRATWQGAAMLSTRLLESGIRHIRDGFSDRLKRQKERSRQSSLKLAER